MKYLLTILTLIILTPLIAQDIIVFRSGEEKEAIVKKVGVTIIEYVRYDNKEGAVYEVLKDDVFMIKYENGVKDVFEVITEPNKRVEGAFVDERDGEEYRWLKIGEQIWMGENLRYKEGTSPCVKNDDKHCDKCGRYYIYEEAIVACPDGWHLPKDSEWMSMEIEAGMNEGEAGKMGWRGSGKGQSPNILRGGDTGLELFMCGYALKEGSKNKKPKYSVTLLNLEAYYWSATPMRHSSSVYYRHFTKRLSIEKSYASKKKRYSVRCVKDTE